MSAAARWQGSWLDAFSGLYYVVARWYDPRSGAFLSQEDMDFFYHLLAMTSRYAFFIDAFEKDHYAARAAQTATERNTLPSQPDERLTQPLLGAS